MKQNNSNLLYHLVAFITVAIWGTTFVSTKVLMLNGLSFINNVNLMMAEHQVNLRFFLYYLVHGKKMLVSATTSRRTNAFQSRVMICLVLMKSMNIGL